MSTLHRMLASQTGTISATMASDYMYCTILDPVEMSAALYISRPPRARVAAANGMHAGMEASLAPMQR